MGGDGEEGEVELLSVERWSLMDHRRAIDMQEDMMHFHLYWIEATEQPREGTGGYCHETEKALDFSDLFHNIIFTQT